MTYKRKKYHHGDTHLKRRWRVRNRKKDLDEIDNDLKEENAEKLLNQNVDLDLPGAAQHYCLHCARYFIDEKALTEHFKTKVHKRRLKALELEPYSIEESERAAGHGNFKLPNKRKIETQKDNSDVTDGDGDVILDDISPVKRRKLLKTMFKPIINQLFKLRESYLFTVRCSALFINGPKATDTFVYVTPHIDFPESIKNKKYIETNLLKRKSDVDLAKIENLWTLYEDLKNKKNELEKRKAELSNELSNLVKNKPGDNEIEKLKIHTSLLKENLKKLKIPFWSAEEAAIVELLKLPNNLHSQTPTHNCNIIFTYKTEPKNNKNHLKIGTTKNLLQYTNSDNYYLKGDAALFEMGAKFYMGQVLKDNGFIQFSNPDFVKSLVIEGCGKDHTNPKHSFILHHNEDSKVSTDNRLHLTGGGSLFSFFAYYTKNVLYSRVFPLKLFAVGRQYHPANEEEIGLFNVSQSDVISMFIATKNADECDALLEETLETIKTIYTKLAYPFRMVILPADKLQMWESLRVSIQMYSSSLKTFVDVANISVSGDFISKRLMFTYTEEKHIKYPHVISGTILNVPKLLGCVLEQDCDFALLTNFMISNWCVQK